jgi:hypothetical protein
MNKQDARKELLALQKKQKELQAIIDKPEDLFDIIKNYSDVCIELGEDEINEDWFAEEFDKETKVKLVAISRIKQIERLFNGNWVKDWNNRQQFKYYPYFDNTSSGLVFFGSGGRYSRFFNGQVGFYKDKQTSDFIGKTFIDLYKIIQS